MFRQTGWAEHCVSVSMRAVQICGCAEGWENTSSLALKRKRSRRCVTVSATPPSPAGPNAHENAASVRASSRRCVEKRMDSPAPATHVAPSEALDRSFSLRLADTCSRFFRPARQQASASSLSCYASRPVRQLSAGSLRRARPCAGALAQLGRTRAAGFPGLGGSRPASSPQCSISGAPGNIALAVICLSLPGTEAS